MSANVLSMRVRVIGNGKTVIGIVGCVHGDELIGRKIIDRLTETTIPENLKLKLLVANEGAIKKKSRFIESDLNRSFKGNRRGTIEERLAYAIDKELSDCDYVMDLHSTHADMESVIITTTGTFQRADVKRLIKTVPIGKVVIMSKAIGKGRSLIDTVKAGVSIEFSRTVPLASAFNTIGDAIRNISENKTPKTRKETFKAVNFVKGPADKVSMRNFVLVNKGKPFMVKYGKPIRAKYDFYPIFIGEGGYKNKVCMIARKIS
jgi:succinylglutamate desuccinylase